MTREDLTRSLTIGIISGVTASVIFMLFTQTKFLPYQGAFIFLWFSFIGLLYLIPHWKTTNKIFRIIILCLFILCILIGIISFISFYF